MRLPGLTDEPLKIVPHNWTPPTKSAREGKDLFGSLSDKCLAVLLDLILVDDQEIVGQYPMCKGPSLARRNQRDRTTVI